jgi:hypothetical protein
MHGSDTGFGLFNLVFSLLPKLQWSFQSCRVVCKEMVVIDAIIDPSSASSGSNMIERWR